MKLINLYRDQFGASDIARAAEKYEAAMGIVKNFSDYVLDMKSANRGNRDYFIEGTRDHLQQAQVVFDSNPSADHWQLVEKCMLAYQHVIKNVRVEK